MDESDANQELVAESGSEAEVDDTAEGEDLEVGDAVLDDIQDEMLEVPEEELTEEVYKKRMIALLAEKRAKEEELMATLKPIKVKAPKKKKGKGKVTLAALKLLPGDMHLMEYHLVDVKVKQK